MEDKQQKLFGRLDDNLTEYKKQWRSKSADALIEMSRELTAIRDAHYYLTESHGFEPEEIDYLLLFDNPLELSADKWLERTEDLSDFSFALDEVFDKRDALRDYDLAKEKPSVLEKLRAATNLAPVKNTVVKSKEAER